MVSFYILTWFSLLDVLVNKIHGTEIPNPNLNPSSNLNEKDLLIDDFALVKQLAWSDLKIVKYLIKGVEKLREENKPIPQKVEEYIEDFKRENDEIFNQKWTKKTAENIAKNPISSYRLFYRFDRDLPDLTFYLGDPLFERAKNEITPELLDLAETEGQIDLDVASDGILKLQNVYRISAEKVSQGRFPQIDLNGQLDAKHCYEIGFRAMTQNSSSQAVEWLELAVEKSKAEEMDEKNQERVQAKLESAISEHNELYKNDKIGQNPHLFEHLLESDSNMPGNHQKHSRRTRRQTLFQKFEGSRKAEHLEITAAGVCAGENYQTEEEKRHLFCWREFQAHPTFLIGPLKMEFLSQDPDILMIYDFIRDAAIKKIKKAIKNKKTNKLYADEDPREKAEQPIKQGIGKFNWIWDGEPTPDYPTFDLLSVAQNVEALLGHSVRKMGESQLLYVRSYTWNSRARLHVDYGYVTSVIHYLTDVDHGGRTAFPAAGIAVKPVKGAAAVWFNQLRDKGRNQKAIHMSCPLLFGRKIVATKWIIDDANIFKVNCALTKGQQFHFKVNGQDCKRPSRN